jgi:hypothetical protein
MQIRMLRHSLQIPSVTLAASGRHASVARFTSSQRLGPSLQTLCNSWPNAVACRAVTSSTGADDESDDLRQAAIAGGGSGGRNPGLRGRLPGAGGRFTGATNGPAARRRTRPAGRTGLNFRISDGSIPSSAEAAVNDLAAGNGDGPLGPLGGAAQGQIAAGAAVARVSVALCKAGRLDDVVRYYDLRIGPAYCACEGFKTASLLVDRSANTVRSLSFWASNESLLASIENEHYQKVAKGLLQLVDPNSITAQTYEVGAQVQSKGRDHGLE